MHVVYMKSDYVKPLSAVPFDLHLPAAGEGKKRAAAGDPMRMPEVRGRGGIPDLHQFGTHPGLCSKSELKERVFMETASATT